MCTVATWKNNGIAVVSARNMDWHESMHAKLYVMPAGLQRKGLGEEPSSLDWSSKYGSVVSVCYDSAPADGVNEKGLSAHMLWLAESQYPSAVDGQSSISISFWAQYYLDNFATVSDAVNHTKKHPFNVISANIPGTSQKVTTHLALVDKTGDMAVFEYTDGKLHIWHSKNYSVMTNSPSFDQQLQNIKLYDGFGGSKPLPGSTEADDRFVRTAYYLNRLEKPADLRATIAGIVSVLRSAAQPYGKADPNRPNISPTIWRTVVDHTNQDYYFELTNSPFITWLKLAKFDLSPSGKIMMLDIEGTKDLMGDVSDKFSPAEPFTFVLPASTT